MDINKPCLLFFDVDGTLLFGNHRISGKVIDAVNRVRACGHKVFINTGRSRALIVHELTDRIEWDGYICGSTYVELNGEIISEKRISTESIKSIIEYSLEKKLPCLLEGEDKIFSLFGGAFHPSFDITANVENFLAHIEKAKITKFTFKHTIPQSDLNIFPGLRVINFTGCAEAIAEGFVKSDGMKMIADRLRVPYSQTAAFGDSVNDIEMLKFADVAVIVNSSPKCLDEYADIRTSTDFDGVAEGIDRIFFS